MITTPPTLTRQVIAESFLRTSIDWTDSERGYLPHCPGEHLHTNRTARRDCKIYVGGAPSVHCFHTSCAGYISQINASLRSEIGKAERGAAYSPRQLAPAELAQVRERKRLAEKENELRRKSSGALARILAEYSIDESAFRDTSPHPLESDPADDWRLLLSLFPNEATVWIGNKTDSAAEDKPEWQKENAAKHFRPVSDWLKESSPPGNFTCPSTFKNTCYSRSNENVVTRAFLVVESDFDPEKKTGLNRPDTLALIRWLRKGMRLRAVVCTGG